MGCVEISYGSGDRLLVRIRGHHLLVDQPVDEGGEDAGPTPTELFVAGLGACVGFFAERFLRRHGLAVDGLTVRTNYEFTKDRPTRVGFIEVQLVVPGGLTPKQTEALQAVVEHCTVHNSLRQPPEVRIVVGETDVRTLQPALVAAGAA
jgi:putative redox protein